MENSYQNNTSITLGDAFQVWWSIAWKTILVALILGILSRMVPVAEELVSIKQAILAIIALVLQVFFFKKAINRKYKGFEVVVKK